MMYLLLISAIAVVVGLVFVLRMRRATSGAAPSGTHNRLHTHSTHDDPHYHQRNHDLATGAVVGGVILNETTSASASDDGWGAMGSSSGSFDSGSSDSGSSSID